MSYQVLARKWRPKNFSELMGQEHVVTVLVNALMQERLHHAYLFTGTRGVGKTTIARIFAKSLNCQKGITAEPCGECDVCLDIDDGRFVDLIEIDAASRTKVDDTREILDNVQYAPSRGRFKVYLIDEVHMLSKSSFNALLKTLEEPPPHVKFILATTDPQKLPVTVLSRCLQFHLKALTPLQIETKLAEILSAENVTYDDGALPILSKAARGSMRDSLSLTDQAIAQGQGHIVSANLQLMLGGVDQNWIFKILIALIKQDGKGLLEQTKSIASFAPNYHRLLAELLQLLHQVALWQLVPNSIDADPQRASLLTKFAKAMSPEDVQLYYQIVLNGRKDLPYSYDEQAGFDMVILRLLAFKPASIQQAVQQVEQVNESIEFDEGELIETPVAIVSQPNLANSIEVPRSETTVKVDVPKESIVDNRQVSDKKELSKPEALAPVEDTPIAKDLVVQTPSGSAPKDMLIASMNKSSAPEQALSNEQQSQILNDEQQQLETLAQQQFAPLEAYQDEQQFEPVDNNYDDVEPMHSAPPEFERPEVQTNALHSATANVQQQTEQNEQTDTQLAADTESVVEKVLATRNMLRSRKKLSEGSGKKPETKIEHNADTGRNVEPTKKSPLTSAAKNASMLERHSSQNTQPVEQAPTADSQPPPNSPLRNATVSNANAPVNNASTRNEPVNSANLQPAAQVSDSNVDTDLSQLPDFNSIGVFNPTDIDPAVIRNANQIDRWANLIDAMGLGGRVRQLALNATMDASSTDQTLVINLDQTFTHINSGAAQQQIAQSYSELMNHAVNVDIIEAGNVPNTPFIIQSMINDKRLDYAKHIIHNDDFVQHLKQQFDAFVDENSIIAR